MDTEDLVKNQHFLLRFYRTNLTNLTYDELRFAKHDNHWLTVRGASCGQRDQIFKTLSP
jgi:hypothetical protein